MSRYEYEKRARQRRRRRNSQKRSFERGYDARYTVESNRSRSRNYNSGRGRRIGGVPTSGRVQRMRRANMRRALIASAAVVAVLAIFAVVVFALSKMGSNGTKVAATPAPTPVPTVAPTPVPTPTPKPKAVALTFDDGPSRDNTENILAVLKQYNAHATFFVVGNRVEVDADILQHEIEAGCEVGSHSWNHPQLSKIPWSKVKKQLNDTSNIVKKCGNGYEMKTLRPPYGAISEKMRNRLKVPMILWSLDTLDWKSRNAKKVFNNIKKNVKDGDIILMHDIHASTAEAIKKIVPWLSEHGYDMLTVSELFERNGKKLKGGVAYTDGLPE
ncbi:MAG: polysaccharide deacetylase family protein [Eubacterium sp.]|nr:polysaccharide deacetylase family protein [Eubacterium sp.]